MSKLLLVLPLAGLMLAQDRRMLNFYDASSRCVPGPAPSARPAECVEPAEPLNLMRAPKEAAVSVYRMTHKVPGKARKAWRRAFSAAERGRPEESVGYLDEALSYDGEFADALHMRGLYAYERKDFHRAAALLRRAASLDDANPTFLADASVALLTVRNPVDAERHARAALRLNPEQPRARLVLNKLRP